MNTFSFNDCNRIPPAAPLVSEREGKETEKCVICLDGLDKSPIAAMFPCTHIHHKSCIDKWLSGPGHADIGCPMCKRKITHCLYSEKTPLHVAAAGGRSDIVNGLLEHGANANASTKDGITALHCAAGKGDEATIRHLVKQGADVNALTTADYPETPLQLAVFNGHEAAITALIDYGADINGHAPDIRRPLHFAAANGFLNIIDVLLNKGADINIGSRTPLHFAVEHGKHDAIRLLLGRGANINAQSSRLSKQFGFEMVRHLLMKVEMRERTDKSTVSNGEREGCQRLYGKTPLHIAIDTGQAEIVDLLLTAGAATDVLIDSGETLWSWINNENKLTVPIIRSLTLAISNTEAPCDDMRAGLLGALIEINDWNLFDQLFANTPNADINKLHYPGSGQSAFHEVVKEGQKDKIQAMITRRADVNARDYRGWTPLHCAVYSRHPQDAIEVLVGSDVNGRNNEGQTPLHLAAKSGKSDVIVQLIDRGASVNATTDRRVDVTRWTEVEGYQSAMAALALERFKQEFCLRGLLLNGQPVIPDAMVKIDNIGMMTPLHYAAQGGHVKAVQHLLVRGASINERAQNGMTPLKLAESELMKAKKIKVLGLTSFLVRQQGSGLTVAEAKVKSYSDIISLLKAQSSLTSVPSVPI
ncbi:ankyrin repeat domain-containing protein [Endozoicomonas sp. ALB091]|uniref:ankyrin repeat domain-containing protein n=1 Tax=Endozoicomonas sp. ALB091 TaxID=3403073 RepID=UPI003BB7D62C